MAPSIAHPPARINNVNDSKVIGFCSFRRRVLLLAASILGICVISGLAALEAKAFLNPVVPILTFLIACFATAALKLGPAWAASRKPV